MGIWKIRRVLVLCEGCDQCGEMFVVFFEIGVLVEVGCCGGEQYGFVGLGFGCGVGYGCFYGVDDFMWGCGGLKGEIVCGMFDEIGFDDLIYEGYEGFDVVIFVYVVCDLVDVFECSQCFGCCIDIGGFVVIDLVYVVDFGYGLVVMWQV